tara:strand:+ start:1887 stop:3035 length:1149 start_codon:yes stop_codon:yes gene_type:complete
MKIIKEILTHFIIFIIFILSYFFSIKITRVYTARVGHLCIQLDYLIGWKKRNQGYFLLIAKDDHVSNKLIYNKLLHQLKHYIISKKLIYFYKLVNNSPILKKKLMLEPIYQLNYNKKKNYTIKSNFEFNNIEKYKLKNLLVKKNIKKNFVVLHNRDKTYENKFRDKLKDNNFHDHRNFDFLSYKKIIDEFSNIDFLRLGQIASINKLSNKNFYDFTNKSYNELEMSFFIKKCKFMVTGATGFLDIGGLIRKPILLVNFLPLQLSKFLFLPQNSIILPKKIYCLNKKKLLNIREIMSLKDKDIHKNYNFYERNNLKVINNSKDEIFNAFCEMQKKLKKVGEKKSNFEKKIQKKINLISGMKRLDEEYKINFSYSFFKNKNNLI